MPVRRSLALGDLARSQPTLDLEGPPAGDGGPAGPAREGGPAPRGSSRVVRLHVHVCDAAVTGIGYDPSSHGLVRLRETGGFLLAEQVREWCGGAARIVVTPVLDLAEAIHVDSYETTVRQRLQADERDRTCVFPWCTRPAARCDHDHREPWHDGGSTTSDNLAPLCRRHHRHKTHHGWRYETLTPGIYLWTSAHGLRYLRTFAGTVALEPPSSSADPSGPPPASDPPGRPDLPDPPYP